MCVCVCARVCVCMYVSAECPLVCVCMRLLCVHIPWLLKALHPASCDCVAEPLQCSSLLVVLFPLLLCDSGIIGRDEPPLEMERASQGPGLAGSASLRVIANLYFCVRDDLRYCSGGKKRQGGTASKPVYCDLCFGARLKSKLVCTAFALLLCMSACTPNIPTDFC